MEFQYIDTSHEFYARAKEIRIECFFDGMDNADDLINDQYEKDGFHLICIDESGMVLGTGRLNMENSKGIISQMAVKPTYQKSGIGKEILNHLLLKCKEMRLETIELSARETALGFYEKYGFETRGNKYPSQKTGIIHQKMIKVEKYFRE